ncbi:RidA family protein [Desulfoferrobacter suflitae]|uniref:RidA family protein n=1 Tax=Desulfoferrobacter suflitae TaxID=2865782 RepID=UPI0021643CB2|nr:Rid family detoxifying hydrolase [Desulfoferrobacter suflitae]MCK8601434.1 Rid family detoxifying hydrolase [Desulfoferrobacter suflitae]
MKKEAIYTVNAPKPGPYSQAIKYGNLIFVAGQTSEDPGTGKPVHDSIAQQTERILNNTAAILEAAGSSLDKVLKTTVYISSMDHKAEMSEAYKKFFPNDPPARLTVAVAGIDDGLDVEIDFIAAAE